MHDAEIYSVRPPGDTITVAPTSLDFVYHHINDNHLLCLLMDTKRHGPMLIPLTPDQAQYVAAHLQAMVGYLDELRHRYNAENN